MRKKLILSMLYTLWLLLKSPFLLLPYLRTRAGREVLQIILSLALRTSTENSRTAIRVFRIYLFSAAMIYLALVLSLFALLRWLI